MKVDEDRKSNFHQSWLKAMRAYKKYFLLITIILSLILLYCLFDLFGFVQGVNNDTKRMLFARKEYLTQTYFKGKVVGKNICDKCAKLKWSVTIRIDTIKESSSANQMDRTYPPYYEFKKDSLLHMKVPQNIYDKIEIEDVLVKNTGSAYINIDDTKTFQLLSEDIEKWLHDK